MKKAMTELVRCEDKGREEDWRSGDAPKQDESTKEERGKYTVGGRSTTDRGSLPANLPALTLFALYTEFFTTGTLPATSSYTPPTTASNEKIPACR